MSMKAGDVQVGLNKQTIASHFDHAFLLTALIAASGAHSSVEFIYFLPLLNVAFKRLAFRISVLFFFLKKKGEIALELLCKNYKVGMNTLASHITITLSCVWLCWHICLIKFPSNYNCMYLC